MNNFSFKQFIDNYKSKMTYNEFINSLDSFSKVYEEASALTKRAIKVIYLEDHDIYIQIRGYYSNFDDKIIYSNDIDIFGWVSLKEVRPFEIIKTIYKEIK